MAETIKINNSSGNPIGSFTFDESPFRLHASRTANGFKLQLPFKLSLAPVVHGDMAPMVSDFRGVIIARTPDQNVEIGSLVSDSSGSYTAGYRDRDASVQEHENTGFMIWHGSLADLAFYNKLRNGGPVQFIIQLEWRLCYVFKMADSGHMACTLPEWRRPTIGEISVGYSREIWVEMLRSLKVAENVLVEILSLAKTRFICIFNNFPHHSFNQCFQIKIRFPHRENVNNDKLTVNTGCL